MNHQRTAAYPGSGWARITGIRYLKPKPQTSQSKPPFSHQKYPSSSSSSSSTQPVSELALSPWKKHQPPKPQQKPFQITTDIASVFYKLPNGACHNPSCRYEQQPHNGYGLCKGCFQDFWCPICSLGIPEGKYHGMCEECYERMVAMREEGGEGRRERERSWYEGRGEIGREVRELRVLWEARARLRGKGSY
ncbi:hypothetical protein B0T14DRAFT_498837 [Immersiella caudata]|uniref:Uncharacterized protein n=1 Tax=Immersiella caudata TaxID=314043 RepID=A0AA39WDC6_9PEZI|nr:hypothetical protein B0T14DRAFT_498837 [Immersiella caudata]